MPDIFHPRLTSIESKLSSYIYDDQTRRQWFFSVVQFSKPHTFPTFELYLLVVHSKIFFVGSFFPPENELAMTLHVSHRTLYSKSTQRDLAYPNLIIQSTLVYFILSETSINSRCEIQTHSSGVTFWLKLFHPEFQVGWTDSWHDQEILWFYKMNVIKVRYVTEQNFGEYIQRDYDLFSWIWKNHKKFISS